MSDKWWLLPEDVVRNLIVLLHRVDGHLGLAVYRGEGCDERWKKEASDYISEIRSVVEVLEAKRWPPLSSVVQPEEER